MKTKTIITEITHEDIVDLLSTGCGQVFVMDYNKDDYLSLPNADTWVDCIEDKMAKLLLAGKSVLLCDLHAEDESDVYGVLPHHWCEEDVTMDYRLTLEDFKRGLQRCLDGDFEENEGCEREREHSYIRKCMAHFMAADGMEFDMPEAQDILQVIVFGQIVYG